MIAEFDGKAVLVTGAASGLGRASAIAFAAAGGRVAVVDRQQEGLVATMAELTGAGHVSICADLEDATTPSSCIDQAVAALGGLDALCNIAGICRFDHAGAVDAATWDRIMAVNARAPFLLMQAAMPHLIERQGAIVNVASAAAVMGQAYLSHYSASKGALIAMTRSLAMEYIKQPVRINAVAPGGIMTGMAGTMIPPADADPDLFARFMPRRPVMMPEELTDTILMLAGPRGTAYHGAVLNIDRGMTAG